MCSSGHLLTAWLDVDHSKWLKRPIESNEIQYAAEDIRKIRLLYEKFVEKRYIDQDNLVLLSSSYISFHAKARPDGNDKYALHGLLPLALLTKENPIYRVVSCQGCKRNLPPSAFSKTSLRSGKRTFCFVCRAVNTRATRRLAYKYEDSDYDDYDDEDDSWQRTLYDDDDDGGYRDVYDSDAFSDPCDYDDYV